MLLPVRLLAPLQYSSVLYMAVTLSIWLPVNSYLSPHYCTARYINSWAQIPVSVAISFFLFSVYLSAILVCLFTFLFVVLIVALSLNCVHGTQFATYQSMDL